LAASLLGGGAADSALRQLEEVRRIPPDPPEEAAAILTGAMERIRAGELQAAAAELERFWRAMELTAPYQAALAELGRVEGSLVGTPVLTFAPEEILALRGGG